MRPSINCINFIKKSESLKLKAYLCPKKKPTIGWGSIMYPDGKRVKLGDVITAEQAEEFLLWEISKKTLALSGLNLNQNQVDAIMSLVYNIGYSAFMKSTLRRKAIANPNDPTIRNEFMRWVDKGSAHEKGLTNRRREEANLYFKI
jgi:lysozyme